MAESALPNPQLCAATYRAEQIPGRVVITASGYHNTTGYDVFLRCSALSVFPPLFSLWHVASSGIVTDVVTPFTQSVSFLTCEPVEEVTIGDAYGSHTVKVSQAPDFLQRHAAQVPVAATESAGVAELEMAEQEGVAVDKDWSNREGYDPDFLEIDLPLPGLSVEMEKGTVEVPVEYRRRKDRFVLDYHHYSVAMNKTRRMAWYSAANLDGEEQRKLQRRNDRWYIDPRIEVDPKHPRFQMGEELYAAPHTDRGHLTRYLDVAWGRTDREAAVATADTFHFTNCSMQLSGFNQGKDRWQGLERFLLEQKARKEKRRMVVITGPIFRPDDPIYRNQDMDYAAAIPLRFWKVCGLIRQDGTLAATGFILAQQDITKLKGFEESFDVETAQVTIRELERLTGLSFGPFTANDHFAQSHEPGTLEVAGLANIQGLIKAIRSPEDIVI